MSDYAALIRPTGSEERVERVSDKLREGDRVKVKVLEVDKQGRIRLSMKAVPRESRTA